MVKISDWLGKNANHSMGALCSLPVIGKVFLKKSSAQQSVHDKSDVSTAEREFREAVLAYQSASVSHLMFKNRLQRVTARLVSCGDLIPDESFSDYTMMQEIWLNAAMANSVSLAKLQTFSEAIESTAETLQLIVFSDGQWLGEASNDAEWDTAGFIDRLRWAA